MQDKQMRPYCNDWGSKMMKCSYVTEFDLVQNFFIFFYFELNDIF